MSFQPPLRPDPKPKEPRQWYDELMEKLLLYITATLGVLLPGLVYYIYQKVHSVYQKYAERKAAEAAAEEMAQREISIILLGPEKGLAEESSAKVKQALDAELVKPSLLWKSTDLTAGILSTFKGICIILLECVDGHPSEGAEWLLDWLEDVAANPKQKKKTHFDSVRFVVAAFDPKETDLTKQPKAALSLLKRLKILGAKSLNTNAFFTPANIESEFVVWIEALLDDLDRALGPKEDSETESEYLSDSESSDESKEPKKDL